MYTTKQEACIKIFIKLSIHLSILKFYNSNFWKWNYR